ncbi:methyl-accepting chemotaxis protein [Ureibacillus sp. FSL W7-1570]|uniref:methyl-accepting chemotaxis protein n=1 Tax=Ureibacillus sp. FSL W7-1570 TaxID=2954593 RepID=UPI003159B070
MKRSITGKMIAVFSSIILLSCIIISCTSYRSSVKLAEESLSDVARNIAESAVRLIDAERYQQEITLAKGPDTAYYKELREKLNDLRESTGLTYLFTMGREKTGDDYTYFYMVDGFPLDSDEASQMGDEEDVTLYPNIVKAFETGKAQVQISNTKEFGALVTTYVPIRSESGEVIGIVGADLDAATFFDVMDSNRTQLIMITGIILLISILVVYLFSVYLIKPLKKLTNEIEKVGNGDLSVKFEVKRNGEIGALTNAFQKMIGDLKQIIHGINDSSSRLVDSSDHLLASASEVKEGNEQINASMTELSEGADHQANSTSQVSEIMVRFTNHLQEARDEGVKLAHSSNDVIEMTKTGTELMADYEKQMESIHQGVKRSIEKVKVLDAQTNMITELVKIIQDIAEQTNLLALNAAIEAARAGEHGRGFAVVSEEVRKLANEVSNSIGNIVKIVEGIQRESKETVQSLQDSFLQVTEGTSKIKTTRETFNDINQSILQMQSKIETISNHLQEVFLECEQINDAVNHITVVAQESSAGIEQNTALIQESTSAMDEIVSYSKGVADLAKNLNQLVSRFKMES